MSKFIRVEFYHLAHGRYILKIDNNSLDIYGSLLHKIFMSISPKIEMQYAQGFTIFFLGQNKVKKIYELVTQKI